MSEKEFIPENGMDLRRIAGIISGTWRAVCYVSRSLSAAWGGKLKTQIHRPSVMLTSNAMVMKRQDATAFEQGGQPCWF